MPEWKSGTYRFFFLFKNKNKNLENDVYIVIRIYVKQIFTRKVVYLNFELKI